MGVEAAFYRVGDIRLRLGQLEDAAVSFTWAVELGQRLVKDFPHSPDYRMNLARSKCRLGVVLSGLGKWEAAETAVREALATHRELANEFPAFREQRPTWAWMNNEASTFLHNLGTLLRDQGKLSKAQEAYNGAISLRTELSKDFPTIGEYRSRLSLSHNGLAITW